MQVLFKDKEKRSQKQKYEDDGNERSDNGTAK